MKYYATIESEKRNRPAKKGGNQLLSVGLHIGNTPVGLLEMQGMTDGTTYIRYYKAGKCRVIDIQQAKT